MVAIVPLTFWDAATDSGVGSSYPPSLNVPPPIEYPGKPPTPAVWGWYVVLCVLMAACNGVIAGSGVYLASNSGELSRISQDSAAFWQGYGGFVLWIGIVFGLVNLVMPFLPKKPWAYMVHLANILGACLFICPAAMALPILVFWLRPEVREFFELR